MVLIQDGVFALVQDQSILRGLSGVEIVNNKLIVDNVLPGDAKPGQELYVRVKEPLDELRSRRRSVTRLSALGATVPDGDTEEKEPTVLVIPKIAMKRGRLLSTECADLGIPGLGSPGR